MEMTPAQMRRMIVSKYNDPVNAKEAHRIDLISTTPYVIVTDAAENALDVQFPKLREGRKYKVAVSDYIPARRAQGRQPAEDRQHAAAAGGSQIGAAEAAGPRPRNANNRLIFCRFAKNRYLCSPHVCA